MSYQSEPFGYLGNKLSPSYDLNDYNESVAYYEQWVKPMGNISLFAVSQIDGIDVSPAWFALQPKSHWDIERCHCDHSSIYELDEFGEACEGMYEANDESVSTEDNIIKLISLGFKFNKDFQNFMEANDVTKLKINGLSVSDWVSKYYPNCIV